MPCTTTGLSPFCFTQGKVLASSRWSTSRKYQPPPHPPHIPQNLASHRFQSASRRSSSNNSTSCSKSIKTSSARVKTTLRILRCWSTRLRPMASAPPTLPAAEPRSSQGRDDAGATDVVQQRHPSLEQPMGLSSDDGTEKRR